MRKRKFLAILLACTLAVSGVLVNDKSTVSAAGTESISIMEENQKLSYERFGEEKVAGSVAEEYQELSDEVSDFEQKKRLFGDDSSAKKENKKDIEIDNVLTDDGIQALSADNDNPNGAYYLPFNTPTGDNIDTEGESRWYGVIADSKSRITTLMVAADDTADFDLYVYKLNEETSSLELIGYSLEDPGSNEIVDMVVDEGVYYIEINSASGVGQCAVVSYLSTQHIDNEINDTMEYASDLPTAGTVTDAIDSPLDMDVFKFTVSTEGARKKFTIVNPDNCSYAMYIVKAATGSIYSITSGGLYLLEQGDYYLVVASADGTYNASETYTVTVTNQDCVLDAEDMLSYNGYLLQRVGSSGINYYINGKKIDFSYSYKHTVSAGSDYLNATMTLSTKSTSDVFSKYFTDTNGVDHEGIMFIKYNSSFNSSARSLALYIPINDVRYSYHRSASSSLAPTSVHQSYDAFANVIVDVNTGKVIDLFSPNWYYESSASNHTRSIGNIYAICEKE